MFGFAICLVLVESIQLRVDDNLKRQKCCIYKRGHLKLHRENFDCDCDRALSTTRRNGNVPFNDDPALMKFGHDVSLFVAQSSHRNQDTITQNVPECPVFACDKLGDNQAVQTLSDWKPDLIYAHGLLNNSLEAKTQQIAPNLFFLHVYHGSCISGRKRFAVPTLQPCDRKFGAGCLLQYHLRRCGGLNPVRMFSLYFYAKERLANLLRFDSIVTHSFHMFDECVKHGVSLDRLHRFHYSSDSSQHIHENTEADPQALLNSIVWPKDGPIKLLFCARFDQDKGSELIIKVAQKCREIVGRPLELTMVGDGPSRARIERQIAENNLLPEERRVIVHDKGWLPKEQVHQHIKECHLVAFASVWPEPFGLVGPEAGLFAKPVAAFNVGGVGSWLVDDVNGRFASGKPPTVEGLARAIADCVVDEKTYRRLCVGAFEMTERFRRLHHMVELDRIIQLTLEAKR